MKMTLISIPQLCDHGCQAIFDKDQVQILFKDKPIMTGGRLPNGLYALDVIHKPDEPMAMAAVNASSKPEDLVKFAHASLFSPALSTLETAMRKGYLPKIPGLTLQNLSKYKPTSIATVKGHLDMKRINQNSTKPSTKPSITDMEDAFPEQLSDGKRTHETFLSMIEVSGQLHSDLTGRFPVASTQGNNYLLVCYDYDSNNILVEPLTDRRATTQVDAYKKIYQRLINGGCRPQMQRLDNECSHLLQDLFKAMNIDFQLAPPYDHRRLAAERAICTLKNHFIAGLCSTDRDFPLQLWCNLIYQCELTLNLLRGSRLNSKLSAWEQLHGRFDYNRTPIAPPGIKVLVHERPQQ